MHYGYKVLRTRVAQGAHEVKDVKTRLHTAHACSQKRIQESIAATHSLDFLDTLIIEDTIVLPTWMDHKH